MTTPIIEPIGPLPAVASRQITADAAFYPTRDQAPDAQHLHIGALSKLTNAHELGLPQPWNSSYIIVEAVSAGEAGSSPKQYIFPPLLVDDEIFTQCYNSENVYDLPVYLAERLSEDGYVDFDARYEVEVTNKPIDHRRFGVESLRIMRDYPAFNAMTVHVKTDAHDAFDLYCDRSDVIAATAGGPEVLNNYMLSQLTQRGLIPEAHEYVAYAGICDEIDEISREASEPGLYADEYAHRDISEKLEQIYYGLENNIVLAEHKCFAGSDAEIAQAFAHDRDAIKGTLKALETQYREPGMEDLNISSVGYISERADSYEDLNEQERRVLDFLERREGVNGQLIRIERQLERDGVVIAAHDIPAHIAEHKLVEPEISAEVETESKVYKTVSVVDDVYDRKDNTVDISDTTVMYNGNGLVVELNEAESRLMTDLDHSLDTLEIIEREATSYRWVDNLDDPRIQVASDILESMGSLYGDTCREYDIDGNELDLIPSQLVEAEGVDDIADLSEDAKKKVIITWRLSRLKQMQRSLEAQMPASREVIADAALDHGDTNSAEYEDDYSEEMDINNYPDDYEPGAEIVESHSEYEPEVTKAEITEAGIEAQAEADVEAEVADDSELYEIDQVGDDALEREEMLKEQDAEKTTAKIVKSELTEERREELRKRYGLDKPYQPVVEKDEDQLELDF